MSKRNYYIIKILAIVSFVCGIIYFGLSFYAIYEMVRLFPPQEAKMSLGPETLYTWNSAIGTLGILGFFEFIIAIFATGLFFFKKWVFYPFLVFTILLWLLISLTRGGVLGFWYILIAPSIVFIYLILQRKSILNYNKNIVNHG